MKKFKRAYTLSEVLITMAAVGVIAALTIPMISGSTEKSIIGPSAAKAVGLIENGMKGIIETAAERAETVQANNNETEENGLTAATLDTLMYSDVIDTKVVQQIVTSSDMIKDMRGIIGADQVKAADSEYLSKAKLFSGNDLIRSSYNFLNANVAYKFPKCRAYFVYEPASEDAIATYANGHNGNVFADVVIARIMIDANGPTSPNRLGRDIFLFGLTNGGDIVPAGSANYNNNVFNSEEPLYTEDCSSSYGTGASCAARLAADGWELKY